MLCYQFTIGLANDLVDAAADAQAKPWKAIPSGAVARRLALFVAFGLTVCGLALSATLGPVVWSIGVAGLACGLTYDLWLKRTTWSWLPYAVAFPLLPTWVFVATNSWSDRLWWIFPLGAVLGFALHLANQAPDIENDRSIGAGGFAEKLGQERAAHLARALFAACGLLATLIVGWGSARGLLMTGCRPGSRLRRPGPPSARPGRTLRGPRRWQRSDCRALPVVRLSAIAQPYAPCSGIRRNENDSRPSKRNTAPIRLTGTTFTRCARIAKLTAVLSATLKGMSESAAAVWKTPM